MKKILFIFSCLIALSCNDDDKTTTPKDKNAIDLVTGINLVETFDTPPYRLGNPNVFTGNKFLMYPNPAIENFFISAKENITDIWIVPAKAEKIYQEENFVSLLNSDLYSEESIGKSSILSLNGQTSESITVNISTLQSGYYKVFVKTAGEIYWDNLYKISNGANYEQQANALINSWQ